MQCKCSIKPHKERCVDIDLSNLQIAELMRKMLKEVSP